MVATNICLALLLFCFRYAVSRPTCWPNNETHKTDGISKFISDLEQLDNNPLDNKTLVCIRTESDAIVTLPKDNPSRRLEQQVAILEGFVEFFQTDAGRKTLSKVIRDDARKVLDNLKTLLVNCQRELSKVKFSVNVCTHEKKSPVRPRLIHLMINIKRKIEVY